MWNGIINRSFSAEEFPSYINSFNSIMTWKPQFVVLHNTAAPRFDQWNDVPGEVRMKNLEHYYRDQKKWSGGPHLFIADRIWAFTPLNKQGVHSPSWNHISWGVELVGDYKEEFLSEIVEKNAIVALTALHKLLSIDPTTMKLHKEDPLTSHRGCPGRNIDKASFIKQIQEALSSVPVPVVTPRVQIVPKT